METSTLAAYLQPSHAKRCPRFAAVQTCSTDDIAANVDRCRVLVQQAARDGAQWVGLPENFAYLGGGRDHKLSIAEPLDSETPGPILLAMQTLARESGVYLLLGGFPERIAGDAQRIGNTSVLLDPGGTVFARYRKVHLFDVEVPGGQRFEESADIVAGASPCTANLPWGLLGLSICYDLRFPELYRAYAAADARFLSVPAAFTKQTGPDHWHVLLRARAIENQAFVVAPAQWGQHAKRRESYGHAVVIDPWGTVLADCSDKEGYAIASLDLDFQDQVRQRLPCLAHRRL
jgi:predicted amidohydrolase